MVADQKNLPLIFTDLKKEKDIYRRGREGRRGKQKLLNLIRAAFSPPCLFVSVV
jgi:hypothetical protein